MHTVIREIVIGYRRVSVVEPSNVSCCDQSDPCSSDWFESWNLIVILVLEIISIAVALSVAPFCDWAPSRESVKRTGIAALLGTDGSHFL